MIIDANANVGPSIYDDFEFEPTIGRLEQCLTAAGIDRAVVAPLKPPSFDFDRANAALAARVTEHDWITPIGRIDPRVSESEQHASRAVVEYGMSGIKLHPWEESFAITDEMVTPILEVAAQESVPVWIHAGNPAVSHALSIREVANSFPELPLVFTHAAQLDISGLSIPDTMLLAEETENTYFELSGVYRRDLIEDLVDTVGSDRVIFGTNAPSFHPQVEKSRVTTAALTDTQKDTVLGEAIETLLS